MSLKAVAFVVAFWVMVAVLFWLVLNAAGVLLIALVVGLMALTSAAIYFVGRALLEGR